MKRKNFTHKFKLLVVLAFAMLVGQNVWAYDIVSYGLTTAITSTSADVPANRDANFTTTAWSSDGLTANTVSFAGNTAVTSKWDAGNGGSKCWQTAAFSTIGYHTIGVSATMRSDNNAGPRDFNLEYSLDGGGSWYLINSFTVSSVASPKTGSLPPVCQNQASVILRWINTSNVAVGTGSVIATGKSYIKTVSVGGLLPVVPATQAHDLTVISRTPSTITLSWTKGNQADSVVVMMNTTNSFTPLPLDNQTFTAAGGTYTSGRQVIYVGNHSSFTVNVPSATDQYYFRAFDFQTNNGMARYITTSTVPEGVVLNPILCDLENISLNASTFRLTRATLGATIQDPKKSTVFERGIFWSYSPGVTEADNPLQDYNDLSGSFSFPDEVIGRGVTIYYKGYAINESGTIWTSEASLNNTPIFTGTGNWGTAARWNVQEVPGANGDVTYGDILDSPIINGACTLTASNAVTNLTINSSLAINTATILNVDGVLTNNAGTSGILIKSAENEANGSLIWTTGSPSGTVQMFSKAYSDTKYHWQYFGIPLNSLTVSSTFDGNAIVRKYDETNHDPTGANIGLWDLQSSGANLVPVDGYEVVQPSATTYNFRGELYHGNISKHLAYSATADWAGQHILANPYTAAIDISQIDFGVAEAAVYIYNTGSLAEWTANSGSSTPGSNPGTYSVSTAGFAGIFGVPAQIPSMQGFLVKTTVPTTISIPYVSAMSNNVSQRAPKSKNIVNVATVIDVIGENSSDRMWLFTEPSCSHSFDNGFDGRKMLATGANTQLFAQEADGEYQIDALNDINNASLGFQAGNSSNFKMVFTQQNINLIYPSLYLVDLVANKTVDITTNGTEYTFTADPSTTPVTRFKILTATTKLQDIGIKSVLKIISTKEIVSVQNHTQKNGNIQIYKLDGTLQLNAKFGSNVITSIPVSFAAGVYVAKATIDSEEVTQRIIIR